MPQTTKPPLAPELEAFCPTCPAAEDVTALLAKLSFHLAFQMDEQRDHTTQLPPLPAQYHFKDDSSGTEIIYLAGRDTALDGEVFPFHASRFWLSPGADVQAYHLTKSTLALSYRFIWRVPGEHAAQHEEVA